MTSAAAAAKRVREKLKAKGWGRGHVSVRCRNFSMGSAVDVQILHPDVDGDIVKQIVKENAESVRYDEGTGEVLGGGNRFTHVTYSRHCMRAMAAPHLDGVRAAIERLHQNDSTSTLEDLKIAGADVSIGWADGRRGGWVQIWGQSAGRQFFADHSGHENGAFEVELEVRRQRRAAAEAASKPAPALEIVRSDDESDPEPEPVEITLHAPTAEAGRVDPWDELKRLTDEARLARAAGRKALRDLEIARERADRLSLEAAEKADAAQAALARALRMDSEGECE